MPTEYLYLVLKLSLLATNIFIIHIIAKYIGKRREIGYRKTVIWSLLLSPVVGLLVALCSRRLTAD